MGIQFARAALILAAIVAVMFIAFVVAFSGGSEGDHVRSSGRPPAGGPRTGIEWCVEVDPDDDIRLQLQAKSAIETVLPVVALEEEAIHTKLGLEEESQLPRVVESGCPIGSATLNAGERLVSSPGRFSLLIYVLPKREIERHFGSEGGRLTSEELTCAGDVCESVASGLYLMPEEIADPQLIKYWLYEVIGLGCYRPVDAILPFQSPPPGPYNPSEYCNEFDDP